MTPRKGIFSFYGNKAQRVFRLKDDGQLVKNGKITSYIVRKFTRALIFSHESLHSGAKLFKKSHFNFLSTNYDFTKNVALLITSIYTHFFTSNDISMKFFDNLFWVIKKVYSLIHFWPKQIEVIENWEWDGCTSEMGINQIWYKLMLSALDRLNFLKSSFLASPNIQSKYCRVDSTVQ